MRGRQMWSSDGDDAIDMTLSPGKPFKTRSERISCTELVVRPGRSQRPYFLPGFVGKPAVFSKPGVRQNILVCLARAVKKLPVRIYLAREQGLSKRDRIGFCLTASYEMEFAGLGVRACCAAVRVVYIVKCFVHPREKMIE